MSVQTLLRHFLVVVSRWTEAELKIATVGSGQLDDDQHQLTSHISTDDDATEEPASHLMVTCLR